MTSKALGPDIKKGSQVSVVGNTTTFPMVSRKGWDSRKHKLVGNELSVSIQALQDPTRGTDYSLLRPGKYSIEHEHADRSSRFKVSRISPNNSTGYISACDLKSRGTAYFVVTGLAQSRAEKHSLNVGSVASLDVDNDGNFNVALPRGASRWRYHVERTVDPRLSECWDQTTEV